MIKFRLDRVKEVKEKLLDDKRMEMEGCLAEINKVTYDISMMDDKINVNYTNMSVTGLNGNDYYVLREHTIYLEGRKQALIGQRENLKAVADSLRSELVDLLKEVKMLEILKSNALRTIKKSENKREQKMLDELALRPND
jgi:flagellar export protein FliJ